MLLKLFSGHKPNTVISLFLFTVFAWLPAFINPSEYIFSGQENMMPFYSVITNYTGNLETASLIIAIAFILIQSYFLFFINAKFMLIQNRTFLPSFFYIAIVSFYPGLLGISGSLFACFLIIFILALLFDSYSADKNSFSFFISGLVLGLASLFYAKAILFIPIIWISSIIFRPFYWREWVMPLIGVSLPFLFIAGIDYFLGNNPEKILEILLQSFTTNDIIFVPDNSFYIFFGIIFLLISISSIYMLKFFQFRKIYIRNFYLVFFWLFLISLAIFVSFGRMDAGLFYFTAIPVSFILSNYFINAKYSRGNILLFSLFFIVVFLNALNSIFSIIKF